MVISDERKNKDTHLQKLRVLRHKGNAFFTFSSLPGHPRLFRTPIFSPLISARSCYILLSFKAVFSSSRPAFSSPPAFAAAAACTSSSLPLQRLTLMPAVKRLRDLYKSTSSSWHSSAIPNARCNLVGGITPRVILGIWSSINLSELL